MTIGFYSSSTPITKISPKRFVRAKKFLEAKGIHLVAGKLTGKSDYYRSGSIQQRAAEVNELIYNDSIDVIMSTIGGTNTNSILPYIDYDYLNEHPKTFIGYSDTTAILLSVKTMAPQCRVLYGPALVSSFGDWSPYIDETWDYFEKIITAKHGASVTLQAPKYWTDEHANWENYEHPRKKHTNQWKYINAPVLEGKIIGGNLNTIYGFINSHYFSRISKNSLLFIEDAEKDAATVEKNFAMLKDGGFFDNIKGIILGKHALFNDRGTGRQPIDILKEILNNSKLPIIYDYDSCHTMPMITTPIGAKARIDANNMTVTFSDF